MRILFFIEGLGPGGKERRLIELVAYLKLNTSYDLHIVLTDNNIHYKYIEQYNIPIYIIKRKIKKDPLLFIHFLKLCQKIKPDIVHSWANMTTFYAIPSVKLLNINLITNEIADAPPKSAIKGFFKMRWVFNRYFADFIIANSWAGIKAYNVKNKNHTVIYNGFRPERFDSLIPKELLKLKYNISTPFIITMVASFSANKDYETFLNTAKIVNSIRDDITFIAIGDGINYNKISNKAKEMKIPNIIFLGRIDFVESVINISNLGLLFTNSTNHGEGIPNAILEHMILKKPVIATDSGGTRELIDNDKNGYLVKNNDAKIITEQIIKIIDSKVVSNSFGENGHIKAVNFFSLEKMGESFVNIYKLFFK